MGQNPAKVHLQTMERTPHRIQDKMAFHLQVPLSQPTALLLLPNKQLNPQLTPLIANPLKPPKNNQPNLRPQHWGPLPDMEIRQHPG
jgi:hypothetical protein